MGCLVCPSTEYDTQENRTHTDMALREMNDGGALKDLVRLPHMDDFNRTWFAISAENRAAIESEINRRLDELIVSPNPNWGSITNTSIEGGQINPATGIRGDWTGTVFQPIFEACNLNEELAGMFYGNVWKKVIIEREERWIGIRRSDVPESRDQLTRQDLFLRQNPISL